ncbi:MAG: hypothetical protein ACD_46C00070G0003 [uncultured bacterium]|nr:MAG: hypothetical protein ACD_46C00070G0003 [uncultured bacterium]
MISNPANQTEMALQITADPVSALTTSSVMNQPGSTIVQDGDDWTAISNRLYGNSGYATILEAYSGVPLSPGQMIHGQQVIDAYNKARNYTPYQRLMDVMYNSLNPALKTPLPPPPPRHHESFLDEIIIAVVAVVAIIVVPEVAGAVLFPTAFGAVTAGVTAGLAGLSAVQLSVAFAVAGALADAATQGLAIAFDDQHGFSIKEMFENAVASGATAGLGKALGIPELLSAKNPAYLKAFSASVGIGLSVQLFQMSIGLRSKLDIKSIIEQAAAQVIDAKINNTVSKKLSVSTVHAVDETANTTVNAAFGGQVDLTNLAGSYLGDEAADGADYLGKKIKAQSSSKIGKASKPTGFSDKTHSMQTAPRFISPEAAANDANFDPDLDSDDGNDSGISDLYSAYKRNVSNDVNDMYDAGIAAQHASVRHEVENHRAMRMQQRQARTTSSPGFFHNHAEFDYHADKAIYDNAVGVVDAGINAVENPVRTFHAMVAVMGELANANAEINLGGLHFMQGLLNPQTQHETMMQFKETMSQLEDDVENVSANIKSSFFQAISSPATAGTMVGGAVGYFVPEEGEAKAAELVDDAARGAGVFGRDVKGATLNPLNLQVTHEMTMSKNEFRRLMDNIKVNGIQEPVKYVEHQGKNYVVDGNHRMIAARHLGISNIPVQKVNLPYSGYRKPDDLYYYGGKF